MREIKFRMWHSKSKFLEPINGYGSANNGVFDLDVGEKEDILMQYTGLKDNNGKEIYEGDVCVESIDEEMGEVYFDEGCFYYRHENVIEQLSEVRGAIEIIGNIYEDPNLLN